MSHHNTYQVSENILFQKVGNEAVLLDMTSSKYFGLTPVASRIWELLVEGRPVQTATELIAQEHNVPTERVRQDVNAFLETLTSRGLLIQQQ